MNILQSGICNIILTAGTKSNSTDIYSMLVSNPIMSVILVFVVLIFIAVLICFMKFIPIITELSKTQNKQVDIDSTHIGQATQTTIHGGGTTEYELVDDSELVAVITAAIMASMGNEAPADGLFVRSIRRVSSNRW